MGNVPSATRWRAHCRTFRTNYAIFITYVRLPNQLRMQTGPARERTEETGTWGAPHRAIVGRAHRLPEFAPSDKELTRVIECV